MRSMAKKNEAEIIAGINEGYLDNNNYPILPKDKENSQSNEYRILK